MRQLLDDSPDADVVAARLESAIGSGTGGVVSEEVFWAVRRLVEALASESPLMLVFEDVHWAEPTFLDLVEHLADWIREAPVLIVCLARPELLDGRPGWGGGKLNATSILLEPLTREESSELIGALLAGSELAAEAQARVAEAAQGNPLFLEQMVAMLAESEDGADEIAVPPAIQALLAARLDGLEPDERRVLACASIEGEVFHLRGVVELVAPEAREAIADHLMSLVRKELIRPRPPGSAGEAFGFRHALIRDTAYDALSKATRSELHARHAAWLEQVLGDRVREADEILGHHLEQAFRYRMELRGADDEALGLADRARRSLAAAGRSALRRGDISAVVNLLERARALPAADERARLELAPDLGSALFHVGDFERAESLLSETIERAKVLGACQIESHAWVVREFYRLQTQPDLIDVAEALPEAERSLAVLQQAGDDLALTRAWTFLWALYQCTGDAAPLRDAAERSLDHARRASSRLDEVWSLTLLGYALSDGPTPVGEGVQICERLLQELAHDPLGEARIVSIVLAPLLAMQGRFEDARALSVRSRAGMEELGVSVFRSLVDFMSSRVETLAGDLQAAERAARAATDRPAGSWAYVLAAIALAPVVCDLGRPAECLQILDESEQHPSPPDWEIVVKRPSVRALALARLGRLARG